ncbi:MAG TPA: ParB/RepB/Spo0J family partition protein [Armatimonadota bacterium]|nr:ParB/RepB/Spo0J family partition protein [Armatimonadota bacterium]
MDTVSVNDLVFDRALNPRAHGVDQEVVEFYAGIFQEVVWPPIVADRATRKLLDGWHRVEAAKRAGIYRLPVLWVDAPEEEFFAHAVKLNLGHGLRLTREERLKAVAKLAREGWTPERIVEFLGCTPILVKQAEQAEDLRAHFRATQHPGAALPAESLAEVAKLEPIDRDAVAEMICDVEAAPADVRRAVRAIRKELVETDADVKKALMDPEFVKLRQRAAEAAAGGGWLFNFASVLDQMEASQISIASGEREAAVALFRRMRGWADTQLLALGAQDALTMEGV